MYCTYMYTVAGGFNQTVTFSKKKKKNTNRWEDERIFFSVEAGCPLGWWSGWRENRIIGAMLDVVSVAPQCWRSGTWKHWLNTYQSFQTPGQRKASWASFLLGPRSVEVQRDSEAHRPMCVCVLLCALWRKRRAQRPEAWTIRVILPSLDLFLSPQHTQTSPDECPRCIALVHI